MLQILIGGVLVSLVSAQYKIGVQTPFDSWSTWRIKSVLLAEAKSILISINTTDICRLVAGECVRYHEGSAAIFEHPDTQCFEVDSERQVKTYQCAQISQCNLRLCVWQRQTPMQFQAGIIDLRFDSSEMLTEEQLAFDQGLNDVPILASEFFSLPTLEAMEIEQLLADREQQHSHKAVYLGVFLTLFFVLIAASIGFLIYRYPHKFRQIRERCTQPIVRPRLVRLQTEEFPPPGYGDPPSPTSSSPPPVWTKADTRSTCSEPTGFSDLHAIIKSEY